MVNASGKRGRVHVVPPRTRRDLNTGGYSVCGTLPTGNIQQSGKKGRWHKTTDPVDCKRCILRLEKMVESLAQCVYDEGGVINWREL